MKWPVGLNPLVAEGGAEKLRRTCGSLTFSNLSRVKILSVFLSPSLLLCAISSDIVPSNPEAPRVCAGHRSILLLGHSISCLALVSFLLSPLLSPLSLQLQRLLTNASHGVFC